MLNLAKLWERTFTKSWEKHIPGGYLTLSTRGGYAALSIAGNLDATNAPVVEAELEAILATEPDLLVFDLAELKYVTSMGFRTFLMAQKAQRKHRGQTSFLNLQPQIQEVFKIMGSLPDVRMFGSIDELETFVIEELDEQLDRAQKSAVKPE